MLRVFTQLTLNTAHLHRSARALGLEDGFPIRGPSRGAMLLTSAMVTVADLIVAVAVASSTAGSQVAHHQPTQPKGRLRREGGREEEAVAWHRKVEGSVSVLSNPLLSSGSRGGNKSSARLPLASIRRNPALRRPPGTAVLPPAAWSTPMLSLKHSPWQLGRLFASTTRRLRPLPSPLATVSLRLSLLIFFHSAIGPAVPACNARAGGLEY